jgi:iron complex outermembrane receptor protein
MLRRLVSGCGVAAVCLTLASHAAAQASARGHVRDVGGRGIAGAIVRVRGIPGERAVTGADGAYTIARVTPGAQTLVARAPGYDADSAVVDVAAGGQATHDFTLRESTVALAPVQAIVGSRAQHTAEDELAVPVDVIPSTVITQQGTIETALVLQSVSPSVNYPHQSVSDATDIVRPFTMRGLSPDETLVLVNGKRYHQTALVHIFGAGQGAGSSGVDMNTLPASAIDRLEVLRDGAAAQYGSDAIAGVVNVVLKHGAFTPQLSLDAGRYQPNDWAPDGFALDGAGAWGLKLGRGWIDLFGEVRDRRATNRAGADPSSQLVAGDSDIVVDGRVVTKRNAVPQPTYHWGDGIENDYLGFVNALLPLNRQASQQVYAFGGYGWRHGIGNGYFRTAMDTRNYTQIYPLGFLPAFEPHVVDASGSAGVRGLVGGWTYDLGGTFGYNLFRFHLSHTLNASLGPCLDTPCAPGLDGILGNADDPRIANQTQFDAGALRLKEGIASLDLSRPVSVGLPSPLNVAAGLAFRREGYDVVAGERASWIQGGYRDPNGDLQPAGSQVFPGFMPSDASSHWRNNAAAYVDLETDVARNVLANVAARYEDYSDFGSRVTGKLAMRVQPTPQVTLRGTVSTGFRAPALSQSWYSSTVTNFVADPVTGKPKAVNVGIFPVTSRPAALLGARPLKPETSFNASAGLALTPFAGLNLTADYFYIDLKDRILLTTELGTDSVAAILADAGLDVVAAQYFSNGLHTHTHGVDVTADWRHPFSARRTLTLNGVFNYTTNRIVDQVPLPAQLQGTGAVLFDPWGEGGLNALEKERPLWRSTLTATYDLGPWTVLGRASSYGKYQSSLYGYCEACLQHYGGKTLVDAEVGRSFTGRGKLSLGVKNLFDVFPERMTPDNSFFIFLYPPASPFGYNGRFVYARMEVGVGR